MYTWENAHNLHLLGKKGKLQTNDLIWWRGGAVLYVNLSRIQIKGLLVITSRAWAWTRSSRKMVTFNFTLYNCTLFLFVKLDTYYFHSQKN